MQVIKDKLPESKIIWTNSTPVTVKDNPGKLFPEINELIIEHNRNSSSSTTGWPRR